MGGVVGLDGADQLLLALADRIVQRAALYYLRHIECADIAVVREQVEDRRFEIQIRGGIRELLVVDRDDDECFVDQFVVEVLDIVRRGEMGHSGQERWRGKKSSDDRFLHSLDSGTMTGHRETQIHWVLPISS